MEKEKLELKHLAPYLPYGLECEILNYKSDYVGIKYATLKGYYFAGDWCHYNFSFGRTNAGKTVDLFKPILRPLSDLNQNVIDFMWFEVVGTDNEVFNYEEFTDSCDSIVGIQFLPIMVYEFLLKEHFDVFGLIEKGLAIDINQLNK